MSRQQITELIADARAEAERGEWRRAILILGDAVYATADASAPREVASVRVSSDQAAFEDAAHDLYEEASGWERMPAALVDIVVEANTRTERDPEAAQTGGVTEFAGRQWITLDNHRAQLADASQRLELARLARDEAWTDAMHNDELFLKEKDAHEKLQAAYAQLRRERDAEVARLTFQTEEIEGLRVLLATAGAALEECSRSIQGFDSRAGFQRRHATGMAESIRRYRDLCTKRYELIADGTAGTRAQRPLARQMLTGIKISDLRAGAEVMRATFRRLLGEMERDRLNVSAPLAEAIREHAEGGEPIFRPAPPTEGEMAVESAYRRNRHFRGIPRATPRP